MRSRHYDIVRKDDDQSAIWLEAASDLRAAESRIAELTSFWPGEFQIMDQQSHQIIEKTLALPTATGPLRQALASVRAEHAKKERLDFPIPAALRY
jgi:hypothetical protein